MFEQNKQYIHSLSGVMMSGKQWNKILSQASENSCSKSKQVIFEDETQENYSYETLHDFLAETLVPLTQEGTGWFPDALIEFQDGRGVEVINQIVSSVMPLVKAHRSFFCIIDYDGLDTRLGLFCFGPGFSGLEPIENLKLTAEYLNILEAVFDTEPNTVATYLNLAIGLPLEHIELLDGASEVMSKMGALNEEVFAES